MRRAGLRRSRIASVASRSAVPVAIPRGRLERSALPPRPWPRPPAAPPPHLAARFLEKIIRPDALPGLRLPGPAPRRRGRWRLGVHGRLRDRLPAAQSRLLRAAAQTASVDGMTPAEYPSTISTGPRPSQYVLIPDSL